MYLDHFGLNEQPFRITPHTDFFFDGANRGATLEALLYAISHDEGIVKVTGEVGSGKTMLCRVLMERLPENVETIYIANPSLSRDEILYAIADELQLEVANDRPSRLLRGLLERLIALYSEGQRVVVLIDEAHAMPRETLEEIRLLSNLESNRNKLLQLVMFGQPELDAHLDTAEMRQLKERITHGFRLDPLVREDVERYLEFRMRAAGYRGRNVFTAAAIKMITDASEGLTRRVNILADKSLLAAFAENTHEIGAREVRRAVRDSEFYRRRRDWRPLALTVGGVAGGLVLGLGAHSLLTGSEPRQAPEPARAVRVAPVAALPAQAPEAPPPAEAAPRQPAGEQAPPPPTRTPLEQAASAPAQAQPAAGSGGARPDAGGGAGAAPAEGAPPQPPARGKFARERFAATQEWLRTAPGERYSIQLFTVSDAELFRLEDFLGKASRLTGGEDLYVYSVKIDGTQYYRVAMGTYPTIAETLAAMSRLPAPLLSQHPFYRTVARMRSQNSQ